MTPEFRFVAKDSVRIGKPCCPKCGGMNMRWCAAGHFYCRRTGCHFTFKKPAKVKATELKARRPEHFGQLEFAGPAYYRGLMWPNGTQNFSYLT